MGSRTWIWLSEGRVITYPAVRIWALKDSQRAVELNAHGRWQLRVSETAAGGRGRVQRIVKQIWECEIAWLRFAVSQWFG